MKAITLQGFGGTEKLKLEEADKPKIKPDEILVSVKASAINRADIEKRKGNYPSSDFDPILGLEIAGVVEEAGEEAYGWEKGERIFGLIPSGGYAEYAVLNSKLAMPIPEHLSYEEAAAVPEVFMTAYQTLHWLGELKQGETVLIHAGASGVGTAAIQLAKQAGATVAVTAGSKEKLDFCKELGADITINYKEEDFAEKLADTGADVILDFIGATYWDQNIETLKTDGRLILIGFLGGTKLENANITPLLAKRLHVKGTLLSTRSIDYKARLTADLIDNVLPLFESQAIKPIVDKVFPLAEVANSHEYMESNKNTGKIVLHVAD
ncbi:NAD(P)H-quinone oxidoreductase [Terribacillus saccharophilus]|uniref:NADPH:quinone oxidoreductase n=1 Tax=Terribacillus saccharophilus TaxID=361277 RepID=A0A268ACZ4_9BACI|nr:NAD(P)H-quinone oxidoreductase [Terribacillus saccharophilus]PAD21988.1 NADPH:quinone oxidoreductase [Terribacillus saccharophilus]PAF19537.1 NADPH:quinone oxidoreductase [Terribacillus saccharophilus]PAF22408.1 NADPH:quinone oxidoreductase [Terribacillus saccharophilus]PAF38597.1 NADPH:quinone oxidoreductase [Terribacillus saccharophilus]PAF40654.1 NADPH:quinone oxidoreductase [Terribacillus saccharophilus]